MGYKHTPYQQTWPPLAARKRIAAERKEREAARQRAEADELDRRYIEWRSRTDANKSVAS